MRLCDQLGNPDAKEKNGRQACYAANTSAERLDVVNAANDLFVLFLKHGKSGLAEKKLIGFMLRERCTVDHQADKRSNSDAPNDGQEM